MKLMPNIDKKHRQSSPTIWAISGEQGVIKVSILFLFKIYFIRFTF